MLFAWCRYRGGANHRAHDRVEALHRVVHPRRDPARHRAVGRRAGQHKQGLGNTGILFEALEERQRRCVSRLHRHRRARAAEDRSLRSRFAQSRARALGLGVAVPLGFENTYALAMLDSKAQELSIRTIGDLAKHPDLALRPVARVPQSQRRLAGLAARLRLAAAAARSRSRARLRGAGRRSDRRDGHLLDRREDRQVQVARPARRQALLPRVRGVARVSARCSAALPGRVGGACRSCREASMRNRWCG